MAGPPLRFSAKKKLAIVERLLRGEYLERVSRETNVQVHQLSEWRDRVLLAAEAALKERERDARDEEIERLKAKVGEITMANELLYAKIDMLEGGRSWSMNAKSGNHFCGKILLKQLILRPFFSTR